MRKFSLYLVFLAIIAVLVACGDSDSTEEETSNQGEDNAEEVTDERWAEIQEAGELVVGTSGTLIGASYYDDNDELTGYDVEVLREIGNRLGLDVSFEIMGIDSMLPAVQNGRIDVAANDIEATDKRKEEFNFSEPYKYSFSTMAVRESDNSGIETLEDLEGKIAGGGATTIYSQIAEHFGAEVKTYGNAPNQAYLSDVSNARTDVVINDYYLTKFGVAAFPDYDLHLHPTLKFHPTEQAVVIPKDADQLTEEMTNALNEMREDGTLSELAIQFYEEDASTKPEGEIEVIEGLEL
ncbi:transporter substrate-binding domain-containing protein [Oceanobacillus sp. CF4.6]|uniref:transporter substrate-binding domain-containing protein n=1 Tax=Oceanobacillus sp. CF4.6 TaxID=3373080 RepID=UPI003EE75EBF